MIKAAGIVRRVDSLGRVVIPVELRNIMMLGNEESIEIYMEGNNIVLEKYIPGCFFCDNAEGLKNVNGKDICMSCLKEAKELVDFD